MELVLGGGAIGLGGSRSGTDAAGASSIMSGLASDWECASIGGSAEPQSGVDSRLVASASAAAKAAACAISSSLISGVSVAPPCKVNETNRI